MTMALVNENLILGLAAIVAVLWTLASCASVYWVLRRRKTVADYTPAITIYKPLKGVDEGLEENLRSFFKLDYPVYQLIFGIADAGDPAVPVVEKLLAEFPDHDTQLVIGAPAFGLNPKVENLAAMERFRKHDVILISDSNVRVRPRYLRETACYLAEPGVGLVSNLFAGVGEETSAAAMENLALNGFIAGAVCLAYVTRITCVVGKSMLMPIQALEAIGGLAAVRNLLAEDQVIGLKVRAAGYSIRLSPHVIDNVNTSRDLRWFLNRHSRWYKIRRRLALPSYLAEPMVNLTSVGCVWAVSGDSGIAWGGFVMLAGLGIARDALMAHKMRGYFPKAKHLLLSPIKDLILLPVWVDSLLSTRVFWRGHRLVIGRYTRLRRAPVGRSTRRRVRRVNKIRSQHLRQGLDHDH